MYRHHWAIMWYSIIHCSYCPSKEDTVNYTYKRTNGINIETTLWNQVVCSLKETATDTFHMIQEAYGQYDTHYYFMLADIYQRHGICSGWPINTTQPSISWTTFSEHSCSSIIRRIGAQLFLTLRISTLYFKVVI